jgi:ATP-dependent Lon protease
MKPTRIPLFPLDLVLFPGMPLPLHIFEPRYKQMMGVCLAEKLEFGMILASEKGITTVGCTAEIIDTLKKYPDGRMDILTEGRNVFTLIALLSEKPYHEGIIEYLPEDATPQDAAKEAMLTQLFDQCHAAMFGRSWPGAQRVSEIPLAYQMAARLPLSLEEKQALLEMRARSDRRDFLIRRMTELLPKLAHHQQVRTSAGSNGHHLN